MQGEVEALLLCNVEKCTDPKKETVVASAWFHDTGCIRVNIEHQVESIHIAKTFLLKNN